MRSRRGQLQGINAKLIFTMTLLRFSTYRSLCVSIPSSLFCCCKLYSKLFLFRAKTIDINVFDRNEYLYVSIIYNFIYTLAHYAFPRVCIYIACESSPACTWGAYNASSIRPTSHLSSQPVDVCSVTRLILYHIKICPYSTPPRSGHARSYQMTASGNLEHTKWY